MIVVRAAELIPQLINYPGPPQNSEVRLEPSRLLGCVRKRHPFILRSKNTFRPMMTTFYKPLPAYDTQISSPAYFCSEGLVMYLRLSNHMKPKLITLILLAALFLNFAFLGIPQNQRLDWSSQAEKFESNLKSLIKTHFITDQSSK